VPKAARWPTLRELRQQQEDAGGGRQNETDDYQERRQPQQAHFGEKPEAETREDGHQTDDAEQPRDDALESRVGDDVGDFEQFVHRTDTFASEETYIV
jgi:hypothetical protein